MPAGPYLKNDISVPVPQKILDNAACSGSPTEWFFPENPHHPAAYDKAAELCAGCPVLLECQEHAIWHEPYGFWGGMSQHARRLARQARRRRAA